MISPVTVSNSFFANDTLTECINSFQKSTCKILLASTFLHIFQGHPSSSLLLVSGLLSTSVIHLPKLMLSRPSKLIGSSLSGTVMLGTTIKVKQVLENTDYDISAHTISLVFVIQLGLYNMDQLTLNNQNHLRNQ